MTWIRAERGWVAAPEEVVSALSTDGFEECKRDMTTSRRDGRPAGGSGTDSTRERERWGQRSGWTGCCPRLDLHKWLESDFGDALIRR